MSCSFRLLQTIDAPMSLRKFPSGACVLQLNSHRDEEIARSTSQLVTATFILFPSFILPSIKRLCYQLETLVDYWLI